MQTDLADFIKDTPEGREADAILRTCVHCGFCNASCPTYQLLDDELDGPRGRIYLIKQALEGQEVTEKTRLHLDRCLTCRACETACPSGVRYGRLLDIGREVVDRRVPRRGKDALVRAVLRQTVPRPWVFAPALKTGQLLRGVLPAQLAQKVPAATGSGAWPPARHARRMLVLAGCVQSAANPDTNPATARVLDKLGISLEVAPHAGCCGAVRFHLDDHDGARNDARRNAEAWQTHVDRGCEAIVISASGCGVFVKDYGHVLRRSARFAGPAQRIAAMTKDVSEILVAEKDRLLELLRAAKPTAPTKLAFHSPCTLQHGQKIRGVVEELLQAAGYALTPVADSHLCCGSAGTYSILQPELSTQLRDNKLAALGAGAPQGIATANIGCQMHLQSGTSLPVKHWIEYLDARLRE